MKFTRGQRAHLLKLVASPGFGWRLRFWRLDQAAAKKAQGQTVSDYHAFLLADVGDTRRNQ